MKADAEPISYIGSGLKFSDGSEVTADVIIFCTGFEKSLRDNAGGIFGPKVGGTLEELWGLDDEGELRGMYKPQNCRSLLSMTTMNLTWLIHSQITDFGLQVYFC